MLGCIAASAALLWFPGPLHNTQNGERPVPLRLAEAARDTSRIWTAHVEYSIRRHFADKEETDPLRTRFVTWKCADDDVLVIHRGDQDGVVQRREPGAPPMPYMGSFAQYALRSDGEVWERKDTEPAVRVWDESAGNLWEVYDLRKLGLDPVLFEGDLEERCRAAGRPPPRYSTAKDGDLTLVTAALENGEVRWWIDPAKEYNVVRTSNYMGGRQIGETRYELEQFDGVWFPKRVELYRLAAGDVEPSTVIETVFAQFNRPEHPQALTPLDIGLEPGMSLSRFKEGQWEPMRYWDGEKPIKPSEFMSQVVRGEFTLGPTVAREAARTKAAAHRRSLLADPSGDSRAVSGEMRGEDDWVRHTRRFIQRYQLDEGQTQRAWSILENCVDRRRQYVEKHRADFERLRAESQATLIDDRNPETAKERAALDSLRERHGQAIVRIFEAELKPRLETLPTRAQRQEAGEGKDGDSSGAREEQGEP